MPLVDGKFIGSFKKLCINQEDLFNEAQILGPELKKIETSWRSGITSDSETCVQIVLLFLKHRVKRHPFLRMGKPIPSVTNLDSFLENIRFYGMPDTVRSTLWRWFRKEWNLILVDSNPDSYEMLKSQSEGYRIVSFIFKDAYEGNFVEEKRDAFEHLLHDLAHGFMFFREDYDYHGQIVFFQEMLSFYPKIKKHLETNLKFKEKFDYCISDMNSHPAHLRSYWLAICREANLNLEV